MDKIIDKLIKGTKKRTAKIEKLLYSFLLDYLVDNISIGDNKIKYTTSNINIVTRLDKYIGSRLGKTIEGLKDFVLNGINTILGRTKKQTLKQIRKSQVAPSVTDKVLKHAATTIEQKVDLQAVYSELKQLVLSEMSNYEGISLKQLRRVLKERIEEKNIVNKYFSRWSHDIYSQYQRVGADKVRQELGLRFAIYQGGVMDDTRDWCKKHNNQVLHESEIQSWANEEWEGKPETGYNPIYDLGGYNCKHRLDWISDELAFRLRPELREKYKNK